jgi:osmoprotectant transport system ATP-binding protein
MIVGLVTPDTGRVAIGGETLAKENVTRLRHGIGYVIQEGGLFPHLTAEDNAALVPRFLKREPSWIASRLAELAELTRLPAALMQRYPRDLSGGQRQRVGIMRALMLDPPLLLFDEPLGALDPITRYELQEELKRIFAALHKTVVLVTHDMHEAAYFADDIVLMRDGRVVQRGSAADLLEHPAEPFVQQFLRAQRAGSSAG